MSAGKSEALFSIDNTNLEALARRKHLSEAPAPFVEYLHSGRNYVADEGKTFKISVSERRILC